MKALLTLGVCAVLAAACARQAAEAPAAPVIVIRAMAGAIEMPEQVAAGWRHIRVLEDSLGHIVVFFRVAGDTTLAIGGGEVGDSADLVLYFEEGTYEARCLRRHSNGRPHAEDGERRRFAVTAATDALDAPRYDIAIAMHDFAFTGVDRWPSGPRRILVTNDGREDHQVRLARFRDGVTLRQWLTDTTDTPLDSTVAGLARTSGGRAAYFDVTLAPGRYILYCSIPADDGAPHVERGMFREIIVE